MFCLSFFLIIRLPLFCIQTRSHTHRQTLIHIMRKREKREKGKERESKDMKEKKKSERESGNHSNHHTPGTTHLHTWHCHPTNIRITQYIKHPLTIYFNIIKCNNTIHHNNWSGFRRRELSWRDKPAAEGGKCAAQDGALA